MRKLRLFFIPVVILFLSFSGKFSPTPYKFPELKYFPKMPVSEDNPVTVEGAKLGRSLFYDPILSADSNMSCASCHKQEHAFSDSPNQFSAGRNGVLTKRNTLPLFNLAWYPSLFWDGKAASIEQQIFHPVRTSDEMNLQWKVAVERFNKNVQYREMSRQAFGDQTIDSIQIANAIAQFLRTLISHQSKYDRVLSGKGRFTKDEYEGFVLVNDQTKGDCLHCHTTDGDALGTRLLFSNNGLDPVLNPEEYKDRGRGGVTGKRDDMGKFMIPSLRNVAFTAPYMHDGRFKTLDDVLDFYSEGVNVSSNIDPKMEFAHRGGTRLTNEERKKIVSFLMTLSDSVFISNPEFGDPKTGNRN